MPEPPPRYPIRGAVNCLDEDAYDDGAPSGAWLGRELINDDRTLHAHLRRCIANTAFTRDYLPLIWTIQPQAMPPVHPGTTSGLRYVEVALWGRVMPAAQAVYCWVSTRAEPAAPPGPRGRYLLTDGGAAAEAEYAVVDNKPALASADERVEVYFAGRVIESTIVRYATVERPTYDHVRVAPGSFAGLPAPPDVLRAARLVRNDPPTWTAATGWRPVVDHDADDELWVYPEWRPEWGDDIAPYQHTYGLWVEVAEVSRLELHSLAVYERRLYASAVDA